VLQLVLYAVALVVGGAVEELLPKCFGVGFPVLLAFAVSVAARKSAVALVLVALAAGAFEDALSSLPTMASPCFFLAVAAAVWRTRFAKSALILSYPLYQVWLKLVVPGLDDSLVLRFLMAVPVAALMAFSAVPLFAWLERKAAVDEA